MGRYFQSFLTLAVCAPAIVGLSVSCVTGQGSPRYKQPSLGPRGRLEYDSAQLLIKSADQVNDLIEKRLDKAARSQASQEVDYTEGIRTEPEALSFLRDAMRIALSRPEQDGFRAAAFSRVDRELADLNANILVLQQLSDEGIGVLQSDDAATNVKATYVYLLDNMMAELKPSLSTRLWAKKIVENIRDARIEISEAVQKQQRMRTMALPMSPSVIAEGILPRQK